MIILGGITRAEISQIQNLEKSAGQSSVIIGTTDILNCEQFFDYFENQIVGAEQVNVELRTSINRQ